MSKSELEGSFYHFELARVCVEHTDCKDCMNGKQWDTSSGHKWVTKGKGSSEAGAQTPSAESLPFMR